MKILKESGKTSGFGDPLLAAAYDNNCFNDFPPSTVDYNGKKALTRPSKDKLSTLYLVSAGIGEQVGNSVYYTLYVVNNATKEVTITKNKLTCDQTYNTFYDPKNLAGTRLTAYQTLIGNNSNFLTWKDITDKGLNLANYTLVDIGTDPDAQKIVPVATYPQLLSGEKLTLWKFKGLTQAARDLNGDQTNTIDYLKKTFNFVDFSDGDVTKMNEYVKFNLKDKASYPQEIKGKDYSSFFTTDYFMLRPKNTTVGGSSPRDNQQAFKASATIQACVDQITTYSEAYTEALTSKASPNTEDKDKSLQCIKNYGLDGFKNAMQKGFLRKNRNYNEFEAKIIDPLFTAAPAQLAAWKLGKNKEQYRQAKTYTVNPKRVTEDVLLKNIISENLNKLKRNKQESLREEMIIKKHLHILTEGRYIKKKSELNNLFGDLLNEVVYLNSKGYDEKIISEEVLNSLAGLFGGTIFGGAYSYFKEYIMKWVVEKLGIDSKGWLGNIIIVGLGNLKIGDLLTIWKCDKFVSFMGGTISEAIIRKYTSSKNMEGPLEGVLRNSITKMLASTHFIKAIEEGLENAICPMLSDLGSKIDEVSTSLANKEPREAPSETNT